MTAGSSDSRKRLDDAQGKRIAEDIVPPKVRSSFTLWSDGALDPRSVDIGVSPTSIMVKGERGKHVAALPQSKWCLSTRLQQGYSIEDEVAGLLAKVWPHREKIRRVLRETDAYVVLGVELEIDNYLPEAWLSGESVRRLAFFDGKLQLNIIMDLPDVRYPPDSD